MNSDTDKKRPASPWRTSSVIVISSGMEASITKNNDAEAHPSESQSQVIKASAQLNRIDPSASASVGCKEAEILIF
jgi:hypothetical protein